MKWLAKLFARAVVRRIALVLVALVMAWLGVAVPARAENYADQGIAYSTCLAHRKAAAARSGWAEDMNQCQLTAGGDAYSCFAMDAFLNPRACRLVAGAGGNAADNIYSWTASCSSRGPLGSGLSKMTVAGNICSNGCAFSGGGGGLSIQLGTSGPWYGAKDGATPTGAVCNPADAGEDLDGEECIQEGTLTQCIRPDGKHCAVSSTGKYFCWEGSEAGTKNSGNEASTKSPAGLGIEGNKPPADPPRNNGDWQQTGSGNVNVSGPGGVTNYNVTNYSSSYGPQGNGGGAEGEGGGGPGNGGGDGEGEGNGPGSPSGGSLTDLYTPTGKTMESVVDGWWDAVQSTPLLSKVNMFFGNCSYSGGCPTWAWESDWTGAVSFTQLCDGTMGDVLTFAGFVVLAMGAFCAFRIAIY